MSLEVKAVDQPYPAEDQWSDLAQHFDSGAIHLTNQVDFAWLELTGKCQEQCVHCYAKSGPDGTHGTLATEQWEAAIDELAGQGARRVQFIGGEVTLHPNLMPLAARALGHNMRVEFFSNMVYLKPSLKAFIADHKDRLSLATSFYSASPSVHAQITRRNTHSPIRKNIRWAIDAGISLRAGVIGVQEEQDMEAAVADLVELGLDHRYIGRDYLRQVGRGESDESPAIATTQFCGHCIDGVAAILPDGSVQPCVFARQPEFTIGNLHENSLQQILKSPRVITVRGLLQRAFAEQGVNQIFGGKKKPCPPDFHCYPDEICDPDMEHCNPDFNWCVPRCNPKPPDE